jgi:hypothetical protein
VGQEKKQELTWKEPRRPAMAMVAWGCCARHGQGYIACRTGGARESHRAWLKASVA